MFLLIINFMCDCENVISRPEMQVNLMNLLEVVTLILEDFCKCRLHNVLKQLLRLCSRTVKYSICFRS